MKEFEVIITETLQRKVKVKASNKKDAKIKENNIRKAYTITFNILRRILLRLLKFSISTPNLL